MYSVAVMAHEEHHCRVIQRKAILYRRADFRGRGRKRAADSGARVTATRELDFGMVLATTKLVTRVHMRTPLDPSHSCADFRQTYRIAKLKATQIESN